MSNLANLELPTVEGLKIEIIPPRQLVMSGTITSLDPKAGLQPFITAVHHAALKDGMATLDVDVSGLTFVNSSAIRLFIDWATWLKAAPPDARYKLIFATDRSVTWQKTSFLAIKSLASSVIEISH